MRYAMLMCCCRQHNVADTGTMATACIFLSLVFFHLTARPWIYGRPMQVNSDILVAKFKKVFFTEIYFANVYPIALDFNAKSIYDRSERLPSTATIFSLDLFQLTVANKLHEYTYCHNNNTLAFCCELVQTYSLVLHSNFNSLNKFKFRVYYEFYRRFKILLLWTWNRKMYLPLSQTACEFVEMKDKLRKLRVATVMATLNGIVQWMAGHRYEVGAAWASEMEKVWRWSKVDRADRKLTFD